VLSGLPGVAAGATDCSGGACRCCQRTIYAAVAHIPDAASWGTYRKPTFVYASRDCIPSSLLPAITDAMLNWGWRVPFLCAAATALLGAALRRNMPEPHAFLEAARLQKRLASGGGVAADAAEDGAGGQRCGACQAPQSCGACQVVRPPTAPDLLVQVAAGSEVRLGGGGGVWRLVWWTATLVGGGFGSKRLVTRLRVVTESVRLNLNRLARLCSARVMEAKV
jgi:hypothetical protein